MKPSILRTAGIAAAVMLAAGVMARAEEGAGQCGEKREKRRAENEAFRNRWKEFNEQIREKVKAHFEAQREQCGVKGELKEKTPLEAVAIIKENMLKCREASQAFFEGIYQERVAFAKQLMAEANVAEDKQAERLAKMEEAYAARKAFNEEMFQKRIDLLTQLAADPDLTWEKLREARKTFCEQRKAECQARRKEHAGEGNQ